MKKTDTTIIDQPWPEHELEHVNACPYCGSRDRTLAYKDVQDWSFYAALGKWSYWDCKKCEALYLSPRPTEVSIGKAYASYYTHGSIEGSLLQKYKIKLKNECFSSWLNTSITPRLNLPNFLHFLLNPLKKLLYIPFGLEQLVTLPKGKLLDVGCGSGGMLKIAKDLGWDVTGLEIDPNAVKAAKEQGLNVIEGSFYHLAQLTDDFDCVICSHVLEHVYEPATLINLLTKVLKPQGVLLLSLPNSKSHVRSLYGENWRGIEAPRHLGIPALSWVVDLLHEKGFSNMQQQDIYYGTCVESNRIMKRLHSIKLLDFIYIKLKQIIAGKSVGFDSDFIQLIARKGA